jgi:hypothetical protein
MSSADLDYIRALLVAQTDEPKPEVQSLLGRLFGPRSKPGPTRWPEPPRRPPPPPRFAGVPDRAAPSPPDLPAVPDVERELLLEHICRPLRAAEPVSPLAPPTPRGEFGRRPDTAPELILDQPAIAARRLQLLDPSGKPVGEMILHPDARPMQGVPAEVGPAEVGPAEVGPDVMVPTRIGPTGIGPTGIGGEVPYFPEDLLDPGAGPQPLRPWLKALRTSGRVQPAPSSGAEGAQRTEPDPDDSAPLVKRVRHRRQQWRRPEPNPRKTLGQDLLEALALALSREQEALADRLSSAVEDGSFRTAATT